MTRHAPGRGPRNIGGGARAACKRKERVIPCNGKSFDKAAEKLAPRAVSPFIEAGGVAAAISPRRECYTGCIDTACTLGMCAERSAIANMITNGEPHCAAGVRMGTGAVPAAQGIHDAADKDSPGLEYWRTPKPENGAFAGADAALVGRGAVPDPAAGRPPALTGGRPHGRSVITRAVHVR
ncbi:MAG: hypothetical protein ACLRZH_16105 [Ruthenibacterium lactatiformans]